MTPSFLAAFIAAFIVMALYFVVFYGVVAFIQMRRPRIRHETLGVLLIAAVLVAALSATSVVPIALWLTRVFGL